MAEFKTREARMAMRSTIAFIDSESPIIEMLDFMDEQEAKHDETLRLAAGWRDQHSKEITEVREQLRAAREDASKVAAMLIDNDRAGVVKWARGVCADWQDDDGSFRVHVEEAAALLDRIDGAEFMLLNERKARQAWAPGIVRVLGEFGMHTYTGDLSECQKAIRRLGERANKNRISADRLREALTTISNMTPGKEHLRNAQAVASDALFEGPVERLEVGLRFGEHVTKFLEGVSGVVEANTFEFMSLWERSRLHPNPVRWEDSQGGPLVKVGELSGMPVCISLQVVVIGAHRILFVDPTSRVVDHGMIDMWLRENLPASARRKDGFLNRVDAMNFHNVFREVSR